VCTSRLLLRFALAAAIGVVASAANAQLSGCARISADAARLACYDDLARTSAAAQPTREQPPAASRSNDTQGSSTIAAATELERRWQLRPDLKQGTFELQPYRPVYALIRATNNPNERAQSPTRPFVAPESVNLQNAEVKLQLSFKTKVLEDVLGSRGDLWFGYTQRSFWQAGNQRYSSLFRESNYEPEAIFVYPLQIALGAVNMRYAGLSLNHQSNGQARPYSRSWNRLIGDLALEYGSWTMHVRPWTRIFESSGERNDNPDIEDYVGRGEIALERRFGEHVISTPLRHTLRSGARSRGAAQADWAFPLAGGMRGHVQLFTGYGESLIDYNHRQTAIGLGVSFFD
jgi:phospholipase A1